MAPITKRDHAIIKRSTCARPQTRPVVATTNSKAAIVVIAIRPRLPHRRPLRRLIDIDVVRVVARCLAHSRQLLFNARTTPTMETTTTTKNNDVAIMTRKAFARWPSCVHSIMTMLSLRLSTQRTAAVCRIHSATTRTTMRSINHTPVNFNPNNNTNSFNKNISWPRGETTTTTISYHTNTNNSGSTKICHHLNCTNNSSKWAKCSINNNNNNNNNNNCKHSNVNPCRST